MSTSTEKRVKKSLLIKKLFTHLTNYKQIIIVSLNNVASGQVQDIRRTLAKSNSDLVIGKNTVIKKAIQYRIEPLDEQDEFYEDFKGIGKPIAILEALKKQMKGKVGLIFSNSPAYDLKPIIESNKLETSAKVGMFAPNDVVIEAGPTGLDPSQISFFHALKISTKIQKGQIELTKDFQVCIKGQVVGQSESTLLQKLSIKPFQYGMEVVSVYDNGSILTPEIVALTDKDILAKFSTGLTNLTALSLQTGIPTACSIPHLISNAFKNLAAISLKTDYKLKQLEQMATASVQQVVAAPKGEAKKAAVVEEEVVEEEQDVDMGGMFGDEEEY